MDPFFFLANGLEKKRKRRRRKKQKKKKEDRREEWKWEVITNNGNEWVGKRAE